MSPQLLDIKRELVEIKKLLQKGVRQTGEVLFISDLRSEKYALNRPIPISIRYDATDVIAKFYDVDMYGVGKDVQEALDDLCAGLVEYYESLATSEEKLGPLPARDWCFLKELIAGGS